jgi:hypothetical protein
MLEARGSGSPDPVGRRSSCGRDGAVRGPAIGSRAAPAFVGGCRETPGEPAGSRVRVGSENGDSSVARRRSVARASRTAALRCPSASVPRVFSNGFSRQPRRKAELPTCALALRPEQGPDRRGSRRLLVHRTGSDAGAFGVAARARARAAGGRQQLPPPAPRCARPRHPPRRVGAGRHRRSDRSAHSLSRCIGVQWQLQESWQTDTRFLDIFRLQLHGGKS